jgi:hypothetical protein
MSSPAAAAKHNALTPHRLIRLSNFAPFDWFPRSRGVFGRRRFWSPERSDSLLAAPRFPGPFHRGYGKIQKTQVLGARGQQEQARPSGRWFNGRAGVIAGAGRGAQSAHRR